MFEDVNGNGVRRTRRAGHCRGDVTLSGVSNNGAITPKTATTDSDGNYAFTGLTPGTYVIAETQPAGYSDGIERIGTPGRDGGRRPVRRTST